MPDSKVDKTLDSLIDRICNETDYSVIDRTAYSPGNPEEPTEPAVVVHRCER